MKLERTKIDLIQEKNIIIASIVSDKFIKDLRQLIPDFSLLVSPYYKLVGGWCFNYYKKYNKAPKDVISAIFENEKQNLSKEQIEFVDELLSHLSSLYEGSDFNSDYYLANAKKYIDERNLLLLSEKVKGMAIKGDTERAYSEVASFKKIETPMGMGIDVINDKGFIEDMFASPDEDVFYISGDLGEAIQSKYRGDVIGIGARQKLGKTWLLMELAKQAYFAGKNVCYYTLEMKGSIMGKRIFKSLTGTLDQGVDAEIVYPFFSPDGIHPNKWIVDYEFQKPDNISQELCEKEQRMLRMRNKSGGFRLFDRTTGGATMEQIDYSLDNLADYDNFLCDVCIIDYDDIVEVNGPDGRDDRSRLNHVWLYAKKMATEKNMLVILASQNGRQTFKRDADVDDISGDIRKFSHVSHWITLNQTPQEKKAHIMRVKVEGRHGDFNPLDEVVCLQNLAIGRPLLDSKLRRNIVNYDEWIEQMNSEFEGE